MNYMEDLRGNVHRCKWTASFDNVVQLESQAYNVVLQVDVESPNAFASCSLDVCLISSSSSSSIPYNMENMQILQIIMLTPSLQTCCK